MIFDGDIQSFRRFLETQCILLVCVCESSDSWYKFNAYSNVMWIHYLMDKLLRAKKYKLRNDRVLLRQLRSALNYMLDYGSAVQVISECRF